MKLLISATILTSLPFLLMSQNHDNFTWYDGAIIRGDTLTKEIALVFTGDEYADGGQYISTVLREKHIKGSFFFTGRFYRNPSNELFINTLLSDGHYLGAHSDRHLLYCDWDNRDSLLVNFNEFSGDIDNNYLAMSMFGIDIADTEYFLPPFEWYNNEISLWCNIKGLQLINYSPGTISHADYTTPNMPNYIISKEIYNNILHYEQNDNNGLNGFILLIHIGASPSRTDKFYFLLDKLINELIVRGYTFCRIDTLLSRKKVNASLLLSG